MGEIARGKISTGRWLCLEISFSACEFPKTSRKLKVQTFLPKGFEERMNHGEAAGKGHKVLRNRRRLTPCWSMTPP